MAIAVSLPSREKMLKLFQEYVLLSNVEMHSIAVATLGVFLAESIRKQTSLDVDVEKVFIATLLHDMWKASQVSVLEPEKYGFKPLTDTQMNVWKKLRWLSNSIQSIYDHIWISDKDFSRKVHETDVASIIIWAKYPYVVQIVNQIWWTRNDVYFDSGIEMMVAHYADWRMHGHSLVDFEQRVDYVINTYRSDMKDEDRLRRKEREFILEKDIFQWIDSNPGDITTDILNTYKSDLFGWAYDYFEIDTTSLV